MGAEWLIIKNEEYPYKPPIETVKVSIKKKNKKHIKHNLVKYNFKIYELLISLN